MAIVAGEPVVMPTASPAMDANWTAGAPGVTQVAPTLGRVERLSGTAPNIGVAIDWQDGSRTPDTGAGDTVDPDDFVLMRKPAASTIALMGKVVQPTAPSLNPDTGSPAASVPSRSEALRGVVVGAFLGQREDGNNLVIQDLGDVLIVRVGVPDAGDGPAPKPGQSWYYLRVADAVVVENA